MSERTYWYSEDVDRIAAGYMPADDGREIVDPSHGNLVSSLCSDGMHMPVLDLDIPHRYEPSSTPGHGHLYLDVPMTWDVCVKLLGALADAGIIEEGFARLSIERGASFVRKPGVHKPAS